MSVLRAIAAGWLVVVVASGCVAQASQGAGPPSNPTTQATAGDLARAASATLAPTGASNQSPRPKALAPGTATRTPPATATPAPEVAAGSTHSAPAQTPSAELPVDAATAVPTQGPTPDGVQRQVRAPILMYHYVSVPPPGADVYRKDLSVTPDQFDKQLAYLKDAGYRAITLDDLLLALTEGKALPEKPVILTFDDGYADNYANAFPLLKKYGVMAEFFVITDFVNQGRAEYMNWSQIEEMGAEGQRFGSHSRDHPNLSGKPSDYLVWQALGGLEAIEQHLGYHPRWIAYPSGAYDAQTIAVYKSANYWGGLTTHQGATHKTSDLFELSRVRIRGSYTIKDFERVLNANW